MGTIKAVIFDLDDTLVQTHKYSFINMQEMARVLGLPPLKREVYEEHYYTGWEETAKRMWPDKDAEELRKLNYDKGPFVAIPSFPCVRETLLGLSRYLRITLGVLSHSQNLERKIAQAGIDPSIFSFLIGRESLPALKPSPRVFEPAEKALGGLGIRLAEAVYIGDHPNDFWAAANNQKIWPAVITTGIHDRKHFVTEVGVDPEFVLDNIQETISLVKKLNEIYSRYSNPE